MSKPIILVDALNLCFRQHFAHKNLSSDGRPTGAIFGAIKTIHDLRENVSDRIVVVWDHGIPVLGAARPRNWRDDIVQGYKAKRKHDDAEYQKIVCQLPDLHKLICVLGYSNVAVMGLEADDVIGVLAHEINEEVLIFSTDQDMYQLLDERRVHILVPKKDGGKFKRIFQSDVERSNGISVAQWAAYLALGGDKSDDIKPMRGMGPKTAIKMVLAGADLTSDFDDQPPAFQMQFAKYREAWPACRRSYKAARIPTRWNDERICYADPEGAYAHLCANIFSRTKCLPSWSSNRTKSEAREYFVKFCADRDMVSLLALRHKLFEEKGEQTWKTGTASAPQKPRGRIALF